MNNYEELIMKVEMLQQEILFLKLEKENLKKELENIKKYALPSKNKGNCICSRKCIE